MRMSGKPARSRFAGWSAIRALLLSVLSAMAPWVSIAAGRTASGQTAGASTSAQPPQTLEDALHEMSDAAGVIFAGQVLGVKLIPDRGTTPNAVEVRFRVDVALRGCVTGQTYVLREWAGLWSNGEVRYRTGQRLLMLLRTPGPAGMSSPVGGMDGAIPIRGVESQIGASSTGMVSGTSTQSPATVMVDLRWVGTRVLRVAPYAAASSDAAKSANLLPIAGSRAGLPSSMATGFAATGSAATGSATGSTATEGASLGTVVGMLAGWERARVAR